MTRGLLIVGTCLVLWLGTMSHANATEQPYQVEWTAQVGTPSYDNCYSVSVDSAGNAFITGYTEGSLSGTNTGDVDAFLTKFDPSGTELWSAQIGSTQPDGSYAVAVDPTGNAYISGWTAGILGGSGSSGSDAFLVKYDPLGNELWSRQIGPGGSAGSTSVAVDATGNAYISGWTGGGSSGNTNAFLAKFDTSGNKLWSKYIGTTSNDHSNAVAVDAAGNAYISGQTYSSLGGPNAGSYDAFLVKFNIPEPASLVLLTLGIPILLRRRML